MLLGDNWVILGDNWVLLGDNWVIFGRKPDGLKGVVRRRKGAQSI